MDLGELYNQVETMSMADIAATCYKRNVTSIPDEKMITQQDLKNVIPQITSERYVKDLTISEFTDIIRNIVRQELSSIPYHSPIYGPQRPQYPWENEVIC